MKSGSFHPPYNFSWEDFIHRALKEDLNGYSDHTSLILIPEKQRGSMILKIKEEGILAGVEAARTIFKKHLGKNVQVKIFVRDGQRVKKGTIGFEVKGPLRDLLMLERLILNIMQRMSGIATYTRQLQDLCRGTKAKVTDTRKTTPLFRHFEKWAISIGGGTNHRFGLYDAVMIKDNHVDAAGGILNALQKAKSIVERHPGIPLIAEARTLNDVKCILSFPYVQQILLDNFTISETRRAVQLVQGKKKLESSGGINEKNIRHYALTGVDFISVGALTHSYHCLDMSLKLKEK